MQFLRQLAARIRRLHPFTWCVTLLAAVVMVIIVVPGENVYRDSVYGSSDQWTVRSDVRSQTHELMQDTHRELLEAEGYDTLVFDRGSRRTIQGINRTSVDVFEHGWPRPYLIRSRGYVNDGNPFVEQIISEPPRSEPWISWGEEDINPFGSGPAEPYVEVRWSNLDHWPYRGDVWHWQWGNLLLDAALLIGVLALVAFASERWIRWRGGLFRLRVAELLVGITVCALALGWVKYHQQLAKVEVELESMGEIGPDGVRIKGIRFSNAVVEVNSKYIGSDWLRKLLGGDEAMLPLLHHATECTYRGYQKKATRDKNWRQDLTRIGKLKYLKSLTIEQLPSYSPNPAWSYLAPFSSIEEPETRLLEIEQLILKGHWFLMEDIEAVCQMMKAEKLVLERVAITQEEFVDFEQTHPEMEISLKSFVTSRDLHLPPLTRAEIIQLLRQQRQRAAAAPESPLNSFDDESYNPFNSFNDEIGNPFGSNGTEDLFGSDLIVP